MRFSLLPERPRTAQLQYECLFDTDSFDQVLPFVLTHLFEVLKGAQTRQKVRPNVATPKEMCVLAEEYIRNLCSCS